MREREKKKLACIRSLTVWLLCGTRGAAAAEEEGGAREAVARHEGAPARACVGRLALPLACVGSLALPLAGAAWRGGARGGGRCRCGGGRCRCGA